MEMRKMTCKDCVHYELCEALEKNGISRIYPSQCGFFKDKTKFVELPCKIGDTVYKFSTLSNRIDEEIIEEFRIGKNYIELMSDTFDGVICRADQIGKIENDLYYDSGYFLSKEEAEQALKGREKQ